MSIPNKTIQVGDLTVKTFCVVEPQQNGTTCIRVKATIGTTSHEAVLTIGAKSGPTFTNLTTEQIKAQMQSDLNIFREKVAQAIALKEQSRLLANELK